MLSTSMAPQVDEDEEKEDPPISFNDVQVPIAQEQDHTQQSQPQDEPQAQQSQPLVRHGRISKDHPLDQVIGSPSKGVRTRSKHASFCEHYSFVSCAEPTCIEEALQDPDWIVAMQEELNNFTRNEVWVLSLLRRTRTSFAPSGYSTTSKMNMELWCATR